MPSLKVLYVAGAGRSGSTLLGNLLGQVPGFFCGGEIYRIFGRGLVEDWYCGCGKRFSECPVWTRVLKEGFGAEGVDPDRVASVLHRLVRVRHLPATIGRDLAGMGQPEQAAGALEILDRLYSAIGDTTDCRVVVDTTKLPPYGNLLEGLDAVDLYVVHLVRDPRGTAFSWSREREREDSRRAKRMEQMSAAKAAGLWSVWNLAAEALWRRSPVPYLRLRYEDLVGNPRESLHRVTELLGEPADLGFVGSAAAELQPVHTISGNPVRMSRGTIDIVEDSEYRREMGRVRYAVVTALTFHSSARYGYLPRRRRRE